MSIVSLSGLGLTTVNCWAVTQTLLPRVAVGTTAGVLNAASNYASDLGVPAIGRRDACFSGEA